MPTLNNQVGAKYFLLLINFAVINGYTSREKILHDPVFSVSDLRTICRNFDKANNVSENCAALLNIVCSNLTLFMTMYDASSRFPYTGLGYTTNNDYGNFDQCLSINYNHNGTRILGEFCTSGLAVPGPSKNISSNDAYNLSVCRPYGCHASDYNSIIFKLTDSKHTEVYRDTMCQTVYCYKTFTLTDKVTVAIFGTVATLMILSTIYDICLNQFQLKNVHPLCTAFSVLSNGKKLLHISNKSQSKEEIQVFHGLRVISMLWIVSGHAIMTWYDVPVFNKKFAEDFEYNRYAGYMVTSPLAVDTFFFMSGFLVAFHYLKNKQKSLTKQVISVPHMYVHRYLRLTPALLMMYLVVISPVKYLGSGPGWTRIEHKAQVCKDNWWAFFLYIQNYYNYKDFCLPQSWYLSADMQLFFISPLVLIPLTLSLRKPTGFRISMIELFLLNVFCVLLPLTTNIFLSKHENCYGTHNKLTNYFIGLMLAVFMREKIDKPFLYIIKEKYRSALNLTTWCLILLGMIATIACYQEVEMNLNYNNKDRATFYIFMRPAWCIGLSWIVYACYHGHGGFVNWILCRPIYQVIGRLTYCIYLVHDPIVEYYALATKVPWYFDDLNTFYLFCGHYFISIIIAILWALAFESPLIVIEKYLTGSGKSMKRGTQHIDSDRDCKRYVSENGDSTEHEKVGEVYKKKNEI